MALSAVLWSADAAAQAIPPTCPNDLGTANIIDHDFTVSFCELCEIGTVRIDIENPYRRVDDADFSDIVITENLLASGLTYVSNSTRFSTNNVPTPPVVQPAVSGPNGSVLTWTLSNLFVLEGRPNNGGGGGTRSLTVEFDVRRHAAVGEEGLVAADRTIEAEVEFTPSCELTYRHTSTSGPGLLPLQEPAPEIIKTGRNVDAGQGSGQYSDPVYGHENDDVIWRLEVRNNGDADLQDLKLSDLFDPGNFDFDYICDNEGDATSVATGGGAGGCAPASDATSLPDI
ncbi:MAG: hypothetical protein ACR2QV_06875, partial [Gammaproteobacteria bacterium]